MGGKTQTTTQNSEPWAAAQPYMKSTMSDAQKLYSQGIGGASFMGSTVVPNSNQTKTAQGWDQTVANDGMASTTDYWNRLMPTLQDGGLNTLQNQQVDRLQGMASGGMMAGNPYLDQMIDKNARNMGDQINLQASGMGRTGSGANQQVLAREVGDMASNARFQNYNTERGYMQDAISSLFNAGQQQKSNMASYGGLMSDAMNLRQQPGSIMRGVGAEYEDLYGRQLNDQLRIFNDSQNKPWEQLLRMNGIAGGMGGMGQSSTATAQSGGGFGEMAGGLISLLGLL